MLSKPASPPTPLRRLKPKSFIALLEPTIRLEQKRLASASDEIHGRTIEESNE